MAYPFQEFDEESTQFWIEKGFNLLEAKKWLVNNPELNVNNLNLFSYLKKEGFLPNHLKKITNEEKKKILDKFDKGKEKVKYIEENSEEIKLINQKLTDNLKELIANFIQAKKNSIKDQFNEGLEEKSWDLEKKLEEQNFSDESIGIITKYCERFTDLENQQLEANIEIINN